MTQNPAAPLENEDTAGFVVSQSSVRLTRPMNSATVGPAPRSVDCLGRPRRAKVRTFEALDAYPSPGEVGRLVRIV